MCSRIPAAGCRASCKLLGLKTEVKGKENIVKDSGCVVLINHQSALDLIGKDNLHFFLNFNKNIYYNLFSTVPTIVTS